MPTSAQIDGFSRALLALLTGVALKYGFDEATWAIVSAAILGMITAGWTIFSNLPKQLIKEVAKNPEVDKILVDNAPLANSIPSPKVVESTS
jgi:uncharacterized membrane protein